MTTYSQIYKEKINESNKTKTKPQVKKVRQGIIPYEGGLIGESKPDFEIGFENDSAYDGYGHVTNGSAGIVEEVKPENINLKSFEIKDNLNPLFWKNNKLNKQIRLKLLDIADAFIKQLEISDLHIEDIIFTGSLANYNWSKRYSDIDLHIVLDFESTGFNKEIVKPYFDSQRKIWNIDHKNVKIYGYPIEIYVQDINEPHKSSGIYSIQKDEWIVKPEQHWMNSEIINHNKIKKKVSKYINIIDKIDKLFKKYKNNKIKLEKLLNKSNDLYIKIKNERKYALNKNNGNELSNGNIIFKALRRSNYIEKLINLRKEIQNIIVSL